MTTERALITAPSCKCKPKVPSVRAQSSDYLAGLEFTSLGAEANTKIPLFVQMNMQAEVSE